MQNQVVLISDESDFFEYITPKLSLRKSDEIFRFSLEELPEKLPLLNNSLLIINAENSHDRVLEIIGLAKQLPVIVFEYNQNDDFMVNSYKAGAFGYITLMTPDDELEAKMIPALNMLSTLEKNSMYRGILVKNNLISKSNEVFLECNEILERELDKIRQKSANAVLAAISPNDKTKFLLKSNQIETIILNNIRKNDLLMSYAPNKYFLLLYDTTIEKAEKIWQKIKGFIPEKIYAGLTSVGVKTRDQAVNEALNKLHQEINREYIGNSPVSSASAGNYKMQKEEFNKKTEQIIVPVFYHLHQKYNDKLFGMSIEHSVGVGGGELSIKSKYSSGVLKITTPGQSKVNIDVKYKQNVQDNGKNKNIQDKRITLEPEEFDAGILEDIVEQFILEFKSEVNNGNTK